MELIVGWSMELSLRGYALRFEVVVGLQFEMQVFQLTSWREVSILVDVGST